MNNDCDPDSPAPTSNESRSGTRPVQGTDSNAPPRDITPSDAEKALTDHDPAIRAAALWRFNVHLSTAQIDRALDDPAAAVRIRAVLRPEPLSPSQVEHALNDTNALVRQAAELRRLRGH